VNQFINDPQISTILGYRTNRIKKTGESTENLIYKWDINHEIEP
jgi:hypothetical protein